jgi:hypothetical protein
LYSNERKEIANGINWPTYRLYGLTVASDFHFANRLAPGNSAPHLSFTCSSQVPFPGTLETIQPTYISPYLTKDGRSDLYLYRQAGYDVLRFTGFADFYLWPDHIICHLLDTASIHLVEICFLGIVLSFWLERTGVRALHASAVSVEGRAVAFIATNSGGKSSLAAMLMKAGYPLLADDVFAIEERDNMFMGRPSYPQMRMWPDQANQFLGHYQDLELVHPEYTKRRVPVGVYGWGTFCDISQPLGCFFLPERSDIPNRSVRVEIKPISPGNGLIELVRNSFTPNLVAAIGLEPERLEFFGRVVQQIPIRHLVYPNGWEHSPHVLGAIVQELAGIS